MPISSVPVQEVVPLNTDTYVPRNTTALIDAICQTIDDLGGRLSAIPEPARPAQVIVAILTDGLENASHRFTREDVVTKIKHQTDVYKWTFLFLGANQDAIATATQMNILASNAATYVAEAAGSRASHVAFSRKARALRRSATDIATAEETADAAAPLASILEEEDSKQRGA